MAFNQVEEKPSIGAQLVQLSVVILVIGALAYLVIKFIMGFIWWILGGVTLAVLFINRAFIKQIIDYIRELYQRNPYMGIAAAIGGVLVFTPFVAFLDVKTIWDFRNSDFLPHRKALPPSAPAAEDAEYTDVTKNNLQ